MRNLSSIIVINFVVLSVGPSYAERDPNTRGIWGSFSQGLQQGGQDGFRAREIENERMAIEASIAENKRIMQVEYDIKMQQLENERLKGEQLKNEMKNKTRKGKKKQAQQDKELIE